MKNYNKIVFALGLIICSLQGLAQNTADIWYFGEFAGVDFTGSSPVSLSNGQLNTIEGCAVAVENSQLLFYTDGITIYNKNHVAMVNGTGLKGQPSATQSAIIVRKPGSSDLFYVFTISSINGATPSDPIPAPGLFYSIVDMSDGIGKVDLANKNKPVNANVVEKVTATKHSNGSDFWIITHNVGTYYSYRLTASGLTTAPVTSAVGYATINNNQKIGYLKTSPDGQYIAQAFYANVTPATTAANAVDIEVLKFNNNTGQVTANSLLNRTRQQYKDGLGAYGLEFSPNGKFLYAGFSSNRAVDQFSTFDNQILQFEITKTVLGDIVLNSSIVTTNSQLLADDDGTATAERSAALVDSSGTAEAPGMYHPFYFGALQLAVDGKIYISMPLRTFLGVISTPDNIIENYTEEGLMLDKKCLLGLPNFIGSDLLLTHTNPSSYTLKLSPDKTNICSDNTVTFTNNTSGTTTGVKYCWDFGDNSPIVERVAKSSVTHLYELPDNVNEVTYKATLFSCNGTGVPAVTEITVRRCASLSFISDGAGCINTPYTFTSVTKGDITPTQLCWDFGDGTSAVGAEVTHQYSTAGIYTVRLRDCLNNPEIQSFEVKLKVKQECDLCEPSFSLSPGQRYIATAWVKVVAPNPATIRQTYSSAYLEFAYNDGNTIIFRPDANRNQIIDGWQLIEGDFIVPTTCTDVEIYLRNTYTDNSQAYFDDIRVHPYDANMRSFVYDPLTLKLVAELDRNAHATKYEYDDEGILTRVKKETSQGVVTIKEHRQSIKKQ